MRKTKIASPRWLARHRSIGADLGGARKRARSCDADWTTKNRLAYRDRLAQPDDMTTDPKGTAQ